MLLATAEKTDIEAGLVGGVYSAFTSLVIFLTVSFAFLNGSIRVVQDLELSPHPCWHNILPFSDCFNGGGTKLACLFAVFFSRFDIIEGGQPRTGIQGTANFRSGAVVTGGVACSRDGDARVLSSGHSVHANRRPP